MTRFQNESVAAFLDHQLPQGWRVVPAKRFCKEIDKRSTTGVEELLGLSKATGVQRKSDMAQRASEAESYSGYKKVVAGDLISNKMQAWNGMFGISPYDGITSPDYAIYRLNSIVEHRFVEYVCTTDLYAREFHSKSRGMGTGFLRLNQSEFLSTPFMLPDLATQRQIADFLDRETARIDLLIEKKQRLVALLGEKYFANLESLTFPEDTPRNEFFPFRWICRIAEGQVDPTSGTWRDRVLIAPNHIESKTGRLLSTETAEEQGAISGKYAFGEGTVLYSKIRPALAKACISPSAGMCSADMYPIIPDKRLRPEYLLMQLLSARFTDWATLESMRVAMPKINRDTLGGFSLRVPPIETQDQYVQSFAQKRAKFEAATDKINASIERLKEYRSALITAAVTGQIDVQTYARSGTADRRLDGIQEQMRA